MQVALYGVLRQKAGGKYVEVATPHGSTIRDVLADLTRRHPDLREYLRPEGGANVIRVFVNSADVRYLEGIGTPVTPDDRIDIFTPVSGG